jgi:hypothetical protein
MAKQQQQKQAAPGAYFRVPGVGVAPRMVQEVGPAAQNTVTNLLAASSVPANFAKFQTLDIVRGYILEMDFAINFEKDAGGDAINISPLAPLNLVQSLQVQFESAYNTFRLNGFLAFTHQMFRPMFPDNQVGIGFPGGYSGVTPANALGSALYSATDPLSTHNLLLVAQTNASGTVQSFKLWLEVPVSMYFDLYWELDTAGRPAGAPIHRAIVSPQYMAATTRNVTPLLTYNALQTQTDGLDSPYSNIAAKAGAVGAGGAKVTQSWQRDGYIPSTNPVTAPPVYGWQLGLDFLQVQIGQANPFALTLDSSVVGQGQILAIWFGIWDPTLSTNVGGFTTIASYLTLELLYGSSVQLRQQTPQMNMQEWSAQHGFVLPTGMFGWDLAMTREGLITNENALNSLIQAGTQVRITFATGSVPAAGSQIFCGLETLKKIGV